MGLGYYSPADYPSIEFDVAFFVLPFQNLDLTQKAREARALRDELDVQRERAQKVHSLETEIQVYKDKISQFESVKSRMEEVKEENKILVETKDMLEDQLEVSRKRCQQIIRNGFSDVKKHIMPK